MSERDHHSLMKCRDRVRRALLDEATRRKEHDDWVERERLAVTVAANEYATATGRRLVTIDDVEAVERFAVGHIDYADKLALYVSELVHGLSVAP